MVEQPRAPAGGLRRFSAAWGVVSVPIAPLVCPPLLGAYLALFFVDALWAQGFSLASIAVMTLWIDGETRGRINENVQRVESALRARQAAADGQEPGALLLRAFAVDVGYSDPGGDLSLFELVEPALRESGYRPIALGRRLPLPPDHGVVILETADATWWQDFTEVARDAAVIVVWPQDTPSLSRELRWLRETGRMAKVALVMAPEALNVMHPVAADGVITSDSAADNEERARSWARVQRFWDEALGISLPDYDPQGALLLVGADGETVWSRRLRTNPEQPRWFVAQMAQDYRRRYGVDFAAVWRDGQSSQAWRGPPVAETWRRLNPAPLSIDRWSFIKPPGTNGLQWRPLGIIAACGWGPTLGFIIVLLISKIF